MFQLQHTDIHTAGTLNLLVSDYLKQKNSLKPFYSHYPNMDGMNAAIAQAQYDYLDRETLVNKLKKQAESVQNTSHESALNIERLKLKNTFTVVTGHQLCLFTGPLYFIYKIISCIQLAEELNQHFPAYNFVPVYWMAGEDHDFAEVNHYRVFGKTLSWDSSQTGSVGEFDTSELKTVLEQFKEVLGNSENANQLTTLFSQAYLEHATLSDATRFLVNYLFGRYGLVSIDGNDADFKQQFAGILTEDIFENSSAKHVQASISSLQSMGYSTQVNPRNINCFYMQKGLRARLEKEEEGHFKVVNSELRFTAQEIQQKLQHNPRLFSPNVVLRPVFQQHILPNLAYVGGPGELAYWLQFKAMFDHYKVFFPVLVPRNFVTIIEKPIAEKINKLHFSPEDLYLSEQELVKRLVDRSGVKPDLNSETTALSVVFQNVLQKAVEVDKTLDSSVKAELQKALTGLQNIEAKMNKAIKQRSETEINQIKTIRQKLFPGEQAQERVDNFSQFYLKHGDHFLRMLKENCSALDFRQKLLIEAD